MLSTFNPESKQISEHWDYVCHIKWRLSARVYEMTDRCWMACPPSRGSCLPLSPIVSPHLCRMVRRPPRGLVSHCLPTCVPVLDGTSLPEVLSPLVSHCLPTGVPVFDGASLVSPCLSLSPCSPCLSLSPGLSPSLSPSLSPILPSCLPACLSSCFSLWRVVSFFIFL